MTPNDVVEDQALRNRFQAEVAYADRLKPSEDASRDDAQVLESPDGLLVAAWLWPRELYDNDPLEIVGRWNRGVGSVDQSQLESGDSVRLAWIDAIDRRRQVLREIIAKRFARIIDSTARAVDRSVEDVKTHLAWSVPLTEDHLNRLLCADSPFPFRVIVGICRALQLDFDREFWELVNPSQLAERVDRSVLAAEITSRLRDVTLEDLKGVKSKLPRLAEIGKAPMREVYPAPARRYRGLYKSLAADGRDHPQYTVDAIDGILKAAGEKGLPSSARERSWWAGSGAKAAGRPQVSAWWAAGYRVRGLEPAAGPVAVVSFEALPGRAVWLADPDRTNSGEYRVPGPPRVPIYPIDQQGVQALSAALTVFAEAARLATLQRERMDAQEATADGPDNPDVRSLVAFLDKVGEATRASLVQHFASVRGGQVDENWLTNLLTKARRQGWTTNLGSRSRPRWTLSGVCPSCGARTLQPYASDRAKCARCGAIASTSPLEVG
ncbi:MULTISPECIES: hypothetical protein [Microbacterium]|uniref:hypothetical protein n=1 Tax=Microbacterium TaxID=33882 RepID=UPI00344B8F53